MTRAVVIEQPGGPEVLSWREVPDAPLGRGEVRLRQVAVALNFLDVYHRAGLYKVGRLPFTPGVEGAGVITEVGEDVTELRAGDRVAYTGRLGAYAESRVIPAERLVRLPDGISEETAAGMMVKGLTAQYLLRQTLPLAKGDVVLWHAAAGGVGLIACQWARHLGIDVIATAGGRAKCERALAAGARHVIDYQTEDFVARVRELTGGRGVRAVFDGVGKDTFGRSLDCLQPFGMLVSFGQSSGPVPPFDIIQLSTKGSLFLTRPTIVTYEADVPRYQAMATELLDVVAKGIVRVEIGNRFPLSEASRAHEALEARRTVGSSILVV
jgi:NADPH2:quinone reductase